MPFHPSLPILLCGQTIPFNRCLRPFREARASIVGPDPQWCNWNIHVVYLSSSFYFLLLVRFSFISVILVSQYLIFSGIFKGCSPNLVLFIAIIFIPPGHVHVWYFFWSCIRYLDSSYQLHLSYAAWYLLHLFVGY